jgi:hypothetical protein
MSIKMLLEQNFFDDFGTINLIQGDISYDYCSWISRAIPSRSSNGTIVYSSVM